MLKIMGCYEKYPMNSMGKNWTCWILLLPLKILPFLSIKIHVEQPFLVGGWPTPLKNMNSSVGATIPNWMEGHKIPWFQTTNQISVGFSMSSIHFLSVRTWHISIELSFLGWIATETSKWKSLIEMEVLMGNNND